jgi:RRXRR protein
MSPQHTVPVIGQDGQPLTPTTPARARKLARAGQAVPFWTRLNTWAIRMVVPTRKEQPRCGLGVDHGHAHEGYAVVCGTENVLNVTLHLPDKAHVVRKLQERAQLRHSYRSRRRRRRPKRFSNRRRKPDWIAPSQLVLVQARLTMLRTLRALYPLTVAGVEDVCFEHAKKRWGATFSTVEIGKARLHCWYGEQSINLSLYQGWETKELRLQYGYPKSSDKGANRFSAHCSDALALAAHVTTGRRVEPGPLVIVDDTYRPVRRKLHDSNTAKGEQRVPYSRGTVRGLRKGLLIGTPTGKTGRLCGVYRDAYRFYDREGKRQVTKTLAWVSATYLTTTVARCSSQHASFPSGLKPGVP